MPLSKGDPAPYFKQRSASNPSYAFDAAAGRYLVLCFFGSAAHPLAERALHAVRQRNDLFDDKHASFFGVSNDREDERQARVVEKYPGYRFFWDVDFKAAKRYGVVDKTGNRMAPTWFVISPSMRIVLVEHFQEDGSDIDRIVAFLESAPPAERFTGMELHAPIVVLPDIIEPELCKAMISLYRANGGVDSGFMQEKDGKTVGQLDYSHKRRRDCLIEDKTLIKALQNRVQRRIVPELKKVHQFSVSRMERYIIARYAADEAGHFRPHRDNTTSGTAHRRFAVSINLNSDFDGGDILFPEYGQRAFRPPEGGAVVFSCSLQHAVNKVTRGERFAFLPFLYDEAAAKIRAENNANLGEGIEHYSAA
ncbi:MAG: redoxin domain-containing protein [Pseudomonadota bacterium]